MAASETCTNACREQCEISTAAVEVNRELPSSGAAAVDIKVLRLNDPEARGARR